MDFLSELQVVHFFPFFTILFIVLFFAYYFAVIRPRTGTIEWIEMEMEQPNRAFLMGRHKMSKSDIMPLALITIIFLFLAVLNLGDNNTVDVLNEIALREELRALNTLETNSELIEDADIARLTELRAHTANDNHMNYLYFDEVFFVRTAVEHIEHLHIFEWTHPPLGKDIIAASIFTFGMTPFGWRMFGAVSGVLMLVVMYIFLKNMFGKTSVATCGTLLFGFEFMRFIMSRIGTIDTFLVLFILTSFFFMYRYVTTPGDARFGKSFLPLALSGIFFGLSVSIKWVGFYAGAGLLVIYIVRQVKLFLHYRDNKKSGFAEYFTKTILLSSIFFVIVPAIVYYVSYIPYGHAWGLTVADGMLWDPWFLQIVWQNQTSMFSYHVDLVAYHPFSSAWWQWIFNIRPTLFVNDHVDGLRATFGAFHNPIITWGGLVAMFVMGVRVFTKRDEKSLFIVIGYLCGLLPWMLVSRILFAYHYFPSSLFLILAICHIFNHILDRKKMHSKSYVYGFTIFTGLIFAIFYPSLSGMFMPNWYYETFVRWLPSWPF
ncbi:MAG: phospholipid carrier-dependent glycosyltransferase [Oscillospiraceae bacterium]|nr:phospholipid carrier-dependent glycosyltransferase [Oscillospiraceae bacterium]MCL2278209.1 phospholipid carrier-dependent glycosyltransferase [Oscillospiraceae bacterium]